MNKLFNYFYFIKMCYNYHMLSLKELLFGEIHDPFEDIQEWYIEYKNNLMKFLENAYIDKVHCGRGYRIIINKPFEFELRSFVARFIPKNNDDNDSSDELKENE